MATTKNEELQARVKVLEEKVYELSDLLGRVIFATYGKRFDIYDPCDGVDRLEWVVRICDEETDDPFTYGLWKYRPEGKSPRDPRAVAVEVA
jgi:hypothetical protein